MLESPVDAERPAIAQEGQLSITGGKKDKTTAKDNKKNILVDHLPVGGLMYDNEARRQKTKVKKVGRKASTHHATAW